MGKLEKIVVLTVLSLVAVILVISFNTSGDPLDALRGSPPLDELAEADLGSDAAGAREPARIAGRDAREPSALVPSPRELDLAQPFDRPTDAARDGADVDPGLEWPEGDERQAIAEERSAEREELLLSSNVGANEADAPARDGELPEGAALRTLAGLEDTWDPELKLYTWRSGDDFVALAERFYADGERAALLRLFNEGRDRVESGESILVPVFDRRGAKPEHRGTGATHLVAEGESLWTIAKQHYGRGSDWQRLFEANRDRLKSPDDVRAGMELSVP